MSVGWSLIDDDENDDDDDVDEGTEIVAAMATTILMPARPLSRGI